MLRNTANGPIPTRGHPDATSRPKLSSSILSSVGSGAFLGQRTRRPARMPPSSHWVIEGERNTVAYSENTERRGLRFRGQITAGVPELDVVRA